MIPKHACCGTATSSSEATRPRKLPKNLAITHVSIVIEPATACASHDVPQVMVEGLGWPPAPLLAEAAAEAAGGSNHSRGSSSHGHTSSSGSSDSSNSAIHQLPERQTASGERAVPQAQALPDLEQELRIQLITLQVVQFCSRCHHAILQPLNKVNLL